MIIISDPNPAGNVLVVPVTSLNLDLKQETHLVLKKGVFIAKETISPALLKKIQEAVKKSTAISKQTVKFFDFF